MPMSLALMGGGGPTVGVSPVTWLTGTIASLAASTSADVQFDLGPQWDMWVAVHVWLKPVAAGGASDAIFQTYFGDTAGAKTRRSGAAYTNSAIAAGYYALNPANGEQTICVRPMGRYLTIACQNANASVAWGSGSSVAVAAYTA